MGSDSDNEVSSRGGTSVADGSDTEIQALDTQSPSSVSSGEKLEEDNADDLHAFQNTVPLDDTIPLEIFAETQLVDLEGETQEIEDLDLIEDVKTQLLDDYDKELSFDSDGEGTDRTEILTDVDAVSDDDSKRGSGDDSVGSEKRQHSPCKQGAKDIILDSDASHDEEERSVPVQRIASSWASGIASQSNNPKRVYTVPCSNPSNSKPQKGHAHRKNNMSNTIDANLPLDNVRKVDQNCDTRRCNENMPVRNDTKIRVGNSTARKLFYEDKVAGNERSTSKIHSMDGETDIPRSVACDHEFAGLSYMESQEPGELSQANALDVVDKFLSVNNVESSQEVYPYRTTKGKSPPVSNAKGPQSLVKRQNLKSPVRETGVFDWVDSREDEGGGDFFLKRKDAFFGSTGQWRSLTQPRDPMRQNFKRGRDVVRTREKEGLNNLQKIMGLSNSDSRLMLHTSEEVQKQSDEKKGIEIHETKIKKNLTKELDEQLNAEFIGEKLGTPDTSRISPDTYDVGFDTQMAAEAMEALFCGTPANHVANGAYQAEPKTLEGPPIGVKRKKSCSENISLQKRTYPSGHERITGQSKQSNLANTKLNKKTSTSCPKPSRKSRVRELDQDSAVKTKVRRGNTKGKQHINTRSAANCIETSGTSSKFVKPSKAVESMDKTCVKEVNKCHSSSISNGHFSSSKAQLKEGYGTSTPIARRTRQCMALNPLKKAEKLSDNVHLNKLEGNDIGVNAVKSLTLKGKASKFGPNQIDEVNKSKPSEHKVPEPDLDKHHEEMTAPTSHVKECILSCPRRMRTRRSISSHFNEVGLLDGPSIVVKGKEPKEQSTIWRKRSNSDTGINFNLDMRKRTRSGVYPHPFLPFPEKSSKRLMGHKPGSDSAGSHSLDVVNRKVIPGVVDAKVSPDSGSKNESVEGAKGNAKFVESPNEKAKRPCSECSTPVNATTPINAASPVCMGDEYHKQSCKNLSKSFLMKELVRLDASEAVPTPVWKDMRRRRDLSSIRVLFSHHLDEDIIKQQKKILTRLGISIASCSSDATHFVADKFVRTRNMLEAIALGKPVVTHLWLESCGQASCFIDEKNYILRDSKKEKEIGFSMPVSLARACQHPILQGKRVFVTPNIKPSKEVVASLVRAVQGQKVSFLLSMWASL
ncbi:PREDICTED: uncharacterized protein LOC104588427 isoform X2 [Nelumbo nucifera]|uniref:BRCT domain-containing protein n=2 Tax=Nelumbo nucifera TaxID=4432 RepID=A0A822Z372_NELNU|nr:PREDICTED: uncharacterized protein LOC104588427 isoform X2 [Nelumbo nucifera]DAD37905.1 TPA_asm: hypothetical protein HUJ06_008546 [Nelumbo nucifera]